MRRAVSRGGQAQLELPGLIVPADQPPPEPRRAVACVRCGWYREPAATCPICQHRAPDPAR